MKSMFKKTAACALILTLILSMAACGKKETASEHQEGQVVVNIDWPVYVDPGVASKDADMMAAVNMYDSLTFPNNDGTISPLVAESWESDSEGKVYTFYLRDDVLFHSGNKLTAEAVSYTHLDVYKRQGLLRPPTADLRRWFRGESSVRIYITGSTSCPSAYRLSEREETTCFC